MVVEMMEMVLVVMEMMEMDKVMDMLMLEIVRD